MDGTSLVCSGTVAIAFGSDEDALVRRRALTGKDGDDASFSFQVHVRSSHPSLEEQDQSSTFLGSAKAAVEPWRPLVWSLLATIMALALA